MDEKVKLSILNQIYGALLSNKQREFIEDYYNNDLTLSEIAQNNDITRQAVRDMLKKGEKKLFEYEEKLKFMEKILNQDEKIQEILSKLTELEKDSSDKEVAVVLNEVKKELDSLVQQD